MIPNRKLKEFLIPYDAPIRELTVKLRDYITNLVPEANELIWDNYNAVAIAYSKSEKLKDAFCHLAVYSKHVNFGFNRGTELTKHVIKLEGKGKFIRHVKIDDLDFWPKEEIEKLVLEAVQISERMNTELKDKQDTGKSIVMSISEKKMRPSNTNIQ